MPRARRERSPEGLYQWSRSARVRRAPAGGRSPRRVSPRAAPGSPWLSTVAAPRTTSASMRFSGASAGKVSHRFEPWSMKPASRRRCQEGPLGGSFRSPATTTGPRSLRATSITRVTSRSLRSRSRLRWQQTTPSSRPSIRSWAHAIPRRGWNSGCGSTSAPAAFTATPGPTAIRLEPAGRPPATNRIPHLSVRRRHCRFQTRICLGLSFTSSTSGRASWMTPCRAEPLRPPMKML